MIYTSTSSGSQEISSSTILARLDRYWLPMDDRPVVRFFTRNLYFPHRFRERLTAEAKHLATLDRGSLPRSPDRTAVLGTLGENSVEKDDRQLLGAVRDIVRAYSEDEELSPTDQSSSTGHTGQRWILIGDGSDTDGFIVLLFSSDRDRPTAVLKIAPAHGKGLTREHEALTFLRTTLSDDLVATLPRPGTLDRKGQWQILPLSVVEGRPAYVEMQASWQPGRNVGRHLRHALEWLVRFQLETRSEETFLSQSADQDAFMDWAARLQQAGIERTSWFESLLLRCSQSPLPLTAGHGDFWARNLLLRGETRGQTPDTLPGVIDWEFFRSRQAPFVDLFHFVVTYGLNYLWSRYRRIEPLDALKATFIDDNPVSGEIRRYLDIYCQRAGIDPLLLQDLFLLYLLKLASREAPECLHWSLRSHLDPGTWLACHRRVRQATTLTVAA